MSDSNTAGLETKRTDSYIYFIVYSENKVNHMPGKLTSKNYNSYCFNHIKCCGAGLEKLSVLPVLDRFLNHKTDFVLNRTQKNRSIKNLLFFCPILNNSL